MRLTRLLLLSVGLWPTESKICQRLVRLAAITIYLLSMVSVILSLCLHVALPVEDLKLSLTFIGLLGFSLMSVLKYVVVIYQEHQVAECIWSMSLRWQELLNYSDRKIMMKNAKTGRLLIIACALFMYGSGMPYVIMFPLFKGPVLRGNGSLLLWSLTHPGYLSFSELQVKSIGILIFSLHCVCGLVRYTVTCGIYSFTILSVMHISSQITITNMMLDKLIENLNCRKLGQIISRHRRLLKFASRLEDTFNRIFLFEVFSSLCIIYCFSYFLITEYENGATVALLIYFLLMLSFAFNISILCYMGETLTEQCGSICEAACRTEWYRLPQKEAKNLILLIMTTQRPVYLTAGKLFNLSILNLSNVIKATATYVNVLGSLTDNSI